MSERRLLFVYGSLKRGMSRHDYLASQSFVGDAQTEARYCLFCFGDYPGMYDRGHSSISGELYDVDASCWQKLDNEEGVQDGLFACRPVQLKAPFNLETAYAYYCLLDPSGRIDSGDCWPIG